MLKKNNKIQRKIVNNISKTTLLFILFAVMTSGNIQAQSDDHHDSHESDVNHYHFSGFGGFTTNYKGKQGYKLGLEYEYRVSELMGVGGTFDFTGHDFEIFAFSLGTTFYPFSFPLMPAIGFGSKRYHGKWKPFIRGVLVYDFHLDNMSIGPMVMYDMFSQNKDIMSIGVTVGFSI